MGKENGHGRGQSSGQLMLRVEYPRSVWEHIIDEWIFSERDRMIIKRRMLDGITFERLADEFELSVRQVKTIVRFCTDTLSKHI